MPIKEPNVLSRADFDQAVVRLRSNISEIAKATAIPRAYLSEFRNGDRMLRPEHQAKLRDHFEQRGIEFEDAARDDDSNSPAPPHRKVSPHPRLRAADGVRCYFQIAASVPDEVVVRTMDLMEANDARLAALLKQSVERDSVLFGHGELSDDTKATLQEAGSLLAENYIFFRMLRGWPALRVKAGGGDPDSLRDTLLALYRPRLEEAGLIEPEKTDNDRAVESGVEGDGHESDQPPETSPLPWMAPEPQKPSKPAKGAA